MKPELRAAQILQKWANECTRRRGYVDFLADVASLQQAIADGITQAECEVLDFSASKALELHEGMVHDRYAGDDPDLAWNGHEYIGRNA